MTPEEAVREARRGLMAIRLEVPTDVANDLTDLVERAFLLLTQQGKRCEELLERAESGADAWGTCSGEWLRIEDLRTAVKGEKSQG